MFISSNIVFQLKLRESTLLMHYQSLQVIIYSSLQASIYILTILIHLFCSDTNLLTLIHYILSSDMDSYAFIQTQFVMIHY